MVATSATRVPDNTLPAINQRIASNTRMNLEHYARHPERIPQRLAELDAEWDIERTLEANAATLATFGIFKAIFGNRLWLLLSGTVTSFLLQHALRGWCPPLPLLRRLGFRTRREIDEERFALKALRGDFAQLDPASPDVGQALEAAQR